VSLPAGSRTREKGMRVTNEKGRETRPFRRTRLMRRYSPPHLRMRFVTMRPKSSSFFTMMVRQPTLPVS
jgi:hypothetical protein